MCDVFGVPYASERNEMKITLMNHVSFALRVIAELDECTTAMIKCVRTSFS